MPDYDVQAVALASPPTSAPVTDYRPGIAVKNLGIHDADVTGYLNVYDRATGLMVATFSLAAADIAPGETRTASASTLWQPTEGDVGKHFLFTGYINYPPDQNLGNNQLQPVDVLVTAEEPPPPPPVEAHASQHEDGGSDQLTVEGLTGKLAEAQEPTEHHARHEEGGEDQIDVGGLIGELATAQTPKAHAVSHGIGGSDPVTGIPPGDHATSHDRGGADALSTVPNHAEYHEVGGEDEIDVTGLHGVLDEPQLAAVHDSSFHDSTVEATANKNQNSGYAGLDAGARMDPDNAPARTIIGSYEQGFSDAAAPASQTTEVYSFGQDYHAGRQVGFDFYGWIELADATPNEHMACEVWLDLVYDNTSHESRHYKINVPITTPHADASIPIAISFSIWVGSAKFITAKIYLKNEGADGVTVSGNTRNWVATSNLT